LAVAALVAVPTVASADRNSDAKSGGGYNDRDRDDDLDAIGLTREGTRLVRFDTGDPDDARTVGNVRKLDGDAKLVGIDYRVQDGKLYGVGDAGGIYTLSDRNATASKLGQLSVPLEGTAFGVDFNPAANALRVVSDTGQNLRQSFAAMPLAATLVDGSLAYPATPPAPPATAPGITGAAYTNNDLDTDTATTLFDIDTVLNQVSLQSPANAGLLAPTGLLGVDADTDAGFDIYSTLRDGRTVDVTGFATLSAGGRSALYEITIFTGEARKLGSFKSPVTDLAVKLDQR